MNLTISTYPYFSYTPSAYVASIFSVLVYVSLLLWFLQSLHFRCRPCIVSILIFVSHFFTFVELVLRATLTNEKRNTKQFYKMTTSFLTISSQVVLASCFQCLMEMRGNVKSRPIDRIILIIVPIGLIGAGILLSVATNLSFSSERILLSFRLRQISIGIIFVYIIFFAFLWRSSTSNTRRRFVQPLLTITTICLIIEASYILVASIPFLFDPLNRSEVWFYIGHLIPIFIALLTWSLLYWWKIPATTDKTTDKCKNNKDILLSHKQTDLIHSQLTNVVDVIT